MKQIEKIKRGLPVALLGFILLALPGLAQAIGTASGDLITNTVSVAYTVGVAQTPITATEDFYVDSKIVFVVTASNPAGSNKTVLPSTTGATTPVNEMMWTISNTGNVSQKFKLTLAGGVSGGTLAPGGATPTYYVSVDNDLSTLGDNTLVVSGDATGDIAIDGDAYVFAIIDVPATETNGELYDIRVTAQSVDSGTLAVLATGAANHSDPAVLADVDIVIADAGDNNTENAVGRYEVSTAALTVTKSSTVTHASGNGFYIPTAVVTYTIVVTNGATGANASSVVITDAVPGNMTYVPASITYDAAAQTDTAADCAGLGTDCSSFAGSTVTVDIGTTSGDMAANDSHTITFQATIN